jgi:hypothetical protein
VRNIKNRDIILCNYGVGGGKEKEKQGMDEKFVSEDLYWI